MGDVVSVWKNRRKAPVKEDAYKLMAIAHRLWLAGAFDQNAFFLAAHVCQRMAENNLAKVVLTHEEVANGYVMLNGKLMAGPVGDSMHAFVGAMQGLYYFMEIVSHYRDTELEQQARDDVHFTKDPFKRWGVDYGSKTPIFFAYDFKELPELEKYARDFIHTHLTNQRQPRFFDTK